MDAWDAEAADQAVSDLLEFLPAAELFEQVRPYGLRCFGSIGHKAIYLSTLERAVERAPESVLPSVARSLVLTLLFERDTAAWEENRERVHALSDSDAVGASEPAEAWDLHETLRLAAPEACAQAVVDAWNDGTSEATLWDAFRLLASEVFWKRPGRRSNTGRNALLPVHAVTVVNALHDQGRRTRRRDLSRLCLLQAAVWLPALRDWLIESTGLRMDGRRLIELGETAPSTADLPGALEGGSPDVVCAHLSHADTAPGPYLAALRRSILQTAAEHHQPKYAAAMVEEAVHAHPTLRPFLLAPAVDYLAHPDDPVTDVHQRSLEALRFER